MAWWWRFVFRFDYDVVVIVVSCVAGCVVYLRALNPPELTTFRKPTICLWYLGAFPIFSSIDIISLKSLEHNHGANMAYLAQRDLPKILSFYAYLDAHKTR